MQHFEKGTFETGNMEKTARTRAKPQKRRGKTAEKRPQNRLRTSRMIGRHGIL